MRVDQDWCLECGTAAPGRLGARPGWRAAFTVVGLTLALVVGASAASYAALTGDAQREAARPSKGAGAPIVAQAPADAQPTDPGATGPGTTQPPAVAPAPPISSSKPVQPSTITPQTSGSGSSSGAGDSGSSSTSGSSDTNNGSPTSNNGSSTSNQGAGSSAAADTTIKIAAAKTYDPAARAGAEFGPSANAIDSSDKSVWDVTTPADDQPLAVGLVLDLGARYKLDSLTISTSTQGFDLEVYGAKGTVIPPDILDARWDHLLNRGAYTDLKPISLTGKSKHKLRYLTLWFTQARDVKDPRVAIRDVTVTGTK